MFGGDCSEANGSSIAFIAEYRDERWLFGGDAHEDALLAGLRRYAQETSESPVHLDGFKVPHHGSVRNISPALLDEIDCRRFLVSTNGAHFEHPDEACIDLIVMTADRPELVFNYRTEFTEKWAGVSSESETTYADGSDAGAADSTQHQDAGGETDATSPVGSPNQPDEAAAPLERAVGTVSGGSAGAQEAGMNDSSSDTVRGDRGRPRAMPPRVRLEVAVFHGSLERADHPVLVGHYAATPLSGAEGFVDRRFQGRLSDRFARGRYPADIGDSLLIRAARRRHPRSGVIVVGLGEYGELTPLRLVATIRQALVSYAFDEADQRDANDPIEYRCRRCDEDVKIDDRTEHSATEGHRAKGGNQVVDEKDYELVPFLKLGISSVLLGATGDQGLSISASVRAVVTATREANIELRAGKEVRAQFTELQLWERSAAEAELAYRAVHSLGNDIPAGADASEMGVVEAAEELEVAEGALENGLRSDADDQVWWRVRVSEVGDTGEVEGVERPAYLHLEFAVGGRLARTGNVVHLVERRRLERLLREMVADPKPGPATHIALFELLFPNQLKWDMMAAQDIQLEVDDATADIPWEMLAARNPEEGTRGQLALRAPMVRQLKLKNIPAVRRASVSRALVIGNPPVGRLGPPLPGAFREAEGVVEVLRASRYEVTGKVFDPSVRADDQTATGIEQALFENDYRIIHVAAHGLFQPDDPTRTGVVIGPDDFITAQLFAQLDVTPDLVFLNCCHLAAVAMGVESGAIEFTRSNLNRLGASLARQLIDSGVRAVVVAGWAVDDAAAKQFACVFYETMLRGTAFGRAVHEARRAAYEASPDHSTWGAYQCYGDGGYRLPNDGADSSSARESVPVTKAEALRWIEAIVNRVESVGPDVDRRREMAEMEAIEQTAEKWIDGDAGRLCEALGLGWAALGDYERAIERLDGALRAKDGAMTLKGLEQYSNFKDRLAAKLLRNPKVSKADRERAETLMAEALASIELLEQLSPSVERTSLRAGHYKRRAAATHGDERAASLREAATAYRAAYDKNQQPYGLCNYVQLEEIRRRVDDDESAASELYDKVDEVLFNLRNTSASNYWDAVSQADALLTVAIVRDEVPDRAATLITNYTEAFDGGSTAAQRASTLDHLQDLAELHPDEVQKNGLLSIHEALTSEHP